MLGAMCQRKCGICHCFDLILLLSTTRMRKIATCTKKKGKLNYNNKWPKIIDTLQRFKNL